MCGGFGLFDFNDFSDRFQIRSQIAKEQKTYNIRPSMTALAITESQNKREVQPMRFGLVPFWAKDTKIGYKLFNARAETIFEKPAWKRSAKSKRCIIPANGFFEWQQQPDGKHPQFIYLDDQKLFSFAGLYDQWTNKESGEEIASLAIITTTPNKEMQPIHDRMPVILNPQSEELWLSDSADEDFLKDLLTPYPTGHIKHYEVSTLVNKASNQGKEVIEPIHT